MPTLPGVIPYPLGAGPSSSGLYTPTGYGYNFAIGGLPFLSAASRETPIVRQTAPFRKQQFDNSNEPGEQSLDGWWIRSQMSFHDGAGQLYADPGAVNTSQFSPNRFYASEGVDCWTAGRLRLLRMAEQIYASPLYDICSAGTRAFAWTGPGGVAIIEGGVVTTEGAFGGGITSVTTDGVYVYAAAPDNGGIWKRLVTDPSGSAWTKIWNIPAGMTTVHIAWVKQRLVLASSGGIYELTTGGPALPAAKWTPPVTGWVPAPDGTFAESSNAIYAAGYNNTSQGGFVLAFTLDNTGTMPTLSSGAVVAQLPNGEYISSIFSYLNRFLAIGSSRGGRICNIGDSGSLEVGPLLFTDGQVLRWAARDDFLYAGLSGGFTSPKAGVYRIDLGEEISNLRFAYAPDAVCANGNGSVPGGITFYGSSSDTMLIGCNGSVYQVNNSKYVDSGYLQSSRVRFDTLEPKVFKLLRVRGAQTLGDFYVSIIDQDGDEHTVIGYVGGQTPGDEDVDIPNLGPQDFVSVKFTLYSASSGTITSEAGGYQLKALPASPRQRILRVPLWCFDFEQDQNGNTSGSVGSASARLAELEDLDTAADVVNLQDLDRGSVERCVIEEVQFVQTAPPRTGFGGFGGIITLTLRTV